MTAFDTNRTTYGSTLVAARITGAIHSMMVSLTLWNDARMTHNALSTLTNRELDDIGLTRADIDKVANGH